MRELLRLGGLNWALCCLFFLGLNGASPAYAGSEDGGKGTIGIVCIDDSGERTAWADVVSEMNFLKRASLIAQFKACVQANLEKFNEELAGLEVFSSLKADTACGIAIPVEGMDVLKYSVEQQRRKARHSRKHRKN